MLRYNINFITLQAVSSVGVTNSYTNFLTIVVLKVYIYHVISFLTFQFRQNSKNPAQNHDRFVFILKIQKGC